MKLAFPRRHGLIFLSMILDIIIYHIAFIVTLSVRFFSSTSSLETNIAFVTVSSLFLIAVFSVFGIYRRIWSKTSGHDLIFIVRAVAVVFVFSLIANLAITPRPIPLSVFVVFNMLACGGFVAVRYRSRLMGAFRLGYRALSFNEFPKGNKEQVLIIGAGESGQNTALRFRQHSQDRNYQVVGFLDDDVAKIGMIIENREVLGTTEQINSIVKRYQIDLIVVAIHKIDGSKLRQIIANCEETDARIKVVPDVLTFVDKITNIPTLRDVNPQDLIGRSIVTKHKDVDLAPVSDRVVLVTGAAGSIGSEIARQILDYNPIKLIIVDNNESALHDLHVELETKRPQMEIIPCLVDVSKYERLQQVYQQYHPQIVFHAAAYKHVPMLEKYPNEAIQVNIGGTINAVELAVLNAVERFVLVSTDKAVEPSSVMGASKRICELVVHAVSQTYGAENRFATVRFGNVLGSRGSVVPTFNRQIEYGGPVTITHPDMSRYFMSISEATNLVIHAAAMTTGDDVFVLRMGEEVKITDLAVRMIRMRGLRPNTDIPIKYVGIRPGEKLHEQLYELDENPIQTKHPYIYKIDSSYCNEHILDFMVRIRNLVRNGIQDDNHALEELRQLIAVVSSNI